MSNASSQPAGFLASSSRIVCARRADRGVPAGDRGDLGQPGERLGPRTPNSAATASAVAALARLTRPGSCSVDQVPGRRSGRPRRRRSTSTVARAAQVAAGAAHQSSPARSMGEPHSGQTQESSCQRWPAATQVTCLGGRGPPRRPSGRRRWPRRGCRGRRRASRHSGGHHGDLLGPVELVAAEVEQGDHARVGRRRAPGAGSARRPRAPRTACAPALARADVCPVGMLAPRRVGGDRRRARPSRRR